MDYIFVETVWTTYELKKCIQKTAGDSILLSQLLFCRNHIKTFLLKFKFHIKQIHFISILYLRCINSRMIILEVSPL